MAGGEEPEFWVRLDPAGCATGSVRVCYVGKLLEDAHKEFTPRIADRRREAAEGWRHEMVTRSEWAGWVVHCIRRKCVHVTGAGG